MKIKVEPSQSEKVTCCTAGTAITISVIVGAAGTINIFLDHIQDPLSKLILVKVELTQSEKVPEFTFGATITILVIVSVSVVSAQLTFFSAFFQPFCYRECSN